MLHVKYIYLRRILGSRDAYCFQVLSRRQFYCIVVHFHFNYVFSYEKIGSYRINIFSTNYSWKYTRAPICVKSTESYFFDLPKTRSNVGIDVMTSNILYAQWFSPPIDISLFILEVLCWVSVKERVKCFEFRKPFNLYSIQTNHGISWIRKWRKLNPLMS